MNTVLEYSQEELTILRRIYASAETVESQAHLLPRRSFDSIEAKAHAIGLAKIRGKSILQRIHELMADGQPRTVRQVEEVIGARRKYIAEQLRLAANGIDYHIHSYTGVHRCYVFKSGPGENAVRPPPAYTPNKVYTRRFRARRRAENPVQVKPKARAQVKPKTKTRTLSARALREPASERLKDEQYRRTPVRLPQANHIVFDAISVMVRVGRQAG